MSEHVYAMLRCYSIRMLLTCDAKSASYHAAWTAGRFALHVLVCCFTVFYSASLLISTRPHYLFFLYELLIPPPCVQSPFVLPSLSHMPSGLKMQPDTLDTRILKRSDKSKEWTTGMGLMTINKGNFCLLDSRVNFPYFHSVC